MPTLDYRSPTSRRPHSRAIVRGRLLIASVIACGLLAVGSAWLSGNMLRFKGFGDGSTHGVGDLFIPFIGDVLVPLIGGALAIVAIVLLIASALLAALFPREADSNWRSGIWVIPAIALVLSVLLFSLA